MVRMTREEAIKTLKENYCAMCAYGSQNMDSCDIRSCDNRDAIKALEQEPKSEWEQDHAILKSYSDGANEVIDKIRAEIEQEYNRLSATRADETLELGECLGLKMSLKFIDKYKAETEET